MQQAAEYCDCASRTVLDIGGGGGWFTSAFRAHGAALRPVRTRPVRAVQPEDAAQAGAVIADGLWLPVRDGAADLVFSSNVLEHVPDPLGLHRRDDPGHQAGRTGVPGLHQLVLAVGRARDVALALPRPALRRAPLRQEVPARAKHEVGVSLHKVHIGPVLRALRGRTDVAVVDAPAAVLPALVPPAGARSGGPRGRHLEPAARPQATVSAGAAVGIPLALATTTAYNLGLILEKRALVRMRAIQLRKAGRLIGTLLTSPAWLAGFALMLAGLACQAIVLTIEPVSVVQPILASGIALTVVLSRLILRERLGSGEFWCVGLMGVGVVLLALSATKAGTKAGHHSNRGRWRLSSCPRR